MRRVEAHSSKDASGKLLLRRATAAATRQANPLSVVLEPGVRDDFKGATTRPAKFACSQAQAIPTSASGQLCFTFVRIVSGTYSLQMVDSMHASVPPDFPRAPLLAALAGAQPKLPARSVDGQYVVGLTPQELQARFDMCQELIEQLVPYCRRKQAERPDWSQEELLSKVATAIRSKDWSISEPELQWIVGQVNADLRSVSRERRK
jgi:hypothetical protein